MKLRVVIGLACAFATLQGDENSDLRLMDLDVIAVDNHGQPVNDLTADDFEITDAGKPQKISFFRHRDNTQWQVPKLAPNEFSNRGSASIPYATAILFDLMNESFGTRGTAANQIVKCLQNMKSAENVFLYALTVEGRIFAVHGLPGAEDVPETETPWNQQIKPLLDRALRDVMRQRPVDVDVAIRVQLTFRALDDLAARLSRVAGRKNVVWVTDGVPLTLGPVRSDTGEAVDFTPELRQLSEGLVRSGIALYPVRQLMIGTPDRIGETSDGAGATNPGTLDNAGSSPRGGGRSMATVGLGEQSLSTLNLLADMTGGRESTSKDTCGALKQAMSDQQVSYQIGYYPPERNWDGKYHKLRVACKRKGVRIQAKTGYFAWVDAPGAGSEQAIRSAALTEFDAAEIGIRGSLQPDPKNKRAADLSVHLDARDITLVPEGDHYNGQLRIAIVGYLLDGKVESTKVIPLDLHYSAEQREKALKDGVAVPLTVPGADKMAKVRLVVYDRDSTAIGSLTIPIGRSNP